MLTERRPKPRLPILFRDTEMPICLLDSTLTIRQSVRS